MNEHKRVYVTDGQAAAVDGEVVLDFLDGDSVLRARWYPVDSILVVWRPDEQPLELRVIANQRVEIRGERRS